MKLNVSDSNIGLNAASMVALGYINFFYSYNDSIINSINKAKSLIKKEILDDIKVVINSNDLSDSEKDYCLNQLEVLKDKLNEDINDFLECFDYIEIFIENVEVFDRLDDIVKGINIPVILNIRKIPDEYLLKNIEKIDAILKENCSKNVRYIINQCLDVDECDYEDNSYDIDDVLLVLTAVDELFNNVKKFNLSPFEQIMYTYDIVKDRVYIASNKEDDYLKSRDLARILKSDKIVCLGFATLFRALLDRLGINNEIIILNGINGNSGHARNMVCVNDSKYNLDHILFFDSTWDCRHNELGIKDEDRYDNFAREKVYFSKKDFRVVIDKNYFPYHLRGDNDYSFIEGRVSTVLFQIKKLFKLIDWENYFINSDITEENLDKLLFLMSDDLRLTSQVKGDYDFCLYMYKECSKMLNRKIDNDNFLRCLYSVRRVEGYLNPDKYNNELDRLFDIYYNRTVPEMDEDNKKMFQLLGFDNMLKNKIRSYDEVDSLTCRNDFLERLRTLNNNINTLDIDKNISVKEAIKILKKN